MATEQQFRLSTLGFGIDDDCPVCGYSWPGCQGQCIAHVSGNGEPGPYHDDYNEDCSRCQSQRGDASMSEAGWMYESERLKVEQLRDEVARLRERKDDAYLERNQVVAALAKCFPSGIARTAIDGWNEEWHGCVYIDLPTGQTSWHYHDSHAHLFAGLPPYKGTWDGHSTEEKYQRLAAITPQAGKGGGA